MGEVVNLRRARKAKARAEAAAAADANRAVHGRSKADRTLADARAEQAEKTLDAHKLEPSDE